MGPRGHGGPLITEERLRSTDRPGPQSPGAWEILPAGPRPVAPPPPRRRWRLSFALFAITCLTTSLVGGVAAGDVRQGLTYAAGIMTILLCHEFGHFLQARRYGVPASPPYFIPMPLPPFGTMGAVILMRPGAASSRQLFDIAVSGPLAGLVPALLASGIGLRMSELVEVATLDDASVVQLSEPLLLQWMTRLLVDVPEGYTLLLSPLAYAGWVGLFVTSLNLLPIGQLDGGHLVYTLLPRYAHRVSRLVLGAFVVVTVVGGYWHWTLLILLLLMFGLRHPPVSRREPLGPARTVIGWLTLALFAIAFTPNPFPT
ncbi:MAG: site-2 protease family protein [Acidobacteriota bacterium]